MVPLLWSYGQTLRVPKVPAEYGASCKRPVGWWSIHSYFPTRSDWV